MHTALVKRACKTHLCDCSSQPRRSLDPWFCSLLIRSFGFQCSWARWLQDPFEHESRVCTVRLLGWIPINSRLCAVHRPRQQSRLRCHCLSIVSTYPQVDDNYFGPTEMFNLELSRLLRRVYSADVQVVVRGCNVRLDCLEGSKRACLGQPVASTMVTA